MEKLTIMTLIMLTVLLTMLFIPSVEVHKKVHYDESRYEYGQTTHWMYENWMKEGYLYGINYRGDLYFVKVTTVTKVNYFAWMDIKIPIFVFSLIAPAYFYSLSREVAIKRRKPL